MKKFAAWLAVVASSIATISLVVITQPAHADTNISPLTTKALMQEVYLCYKNAHYKTGGAKLAEYAGYSNLVDKNPTIAIPSVILDNQKGTSCSDLMLGEGIVRGVQNKFNGVLAEAGFNKSATGEDAASMLQALQFKISGDTEDGTCYRMVFKSVVAAGKSIDLSTNRLCFYNKGGVKVYDEKDDGAKTSFDFSKKVRFAVTSNRITLYFGVDQKLQQGPDGKYILPSGASDCTLGTGSITCPRNNGESADVVLDKFTSYIYALGNPPDGPYSTWRSTNGTFTYTYTTSKITIEAKDELYVSSKMEDKTYALSYKWSGGGSTGINLTGMDAVAALSAKMGNKITNHSDLKFSKDEMFGFYQNHMVDFWGVSGDNLICNKSDFAKASSSDWHDIKMLVDGEIKQCKARAGNNAGSSIWAFTDSRYFSKTIKKSFAEVAAWMDENGDDVDAEEVEADIEVAMSDSTTVEDSDTGSEDLCFDAADAVGWILCPIVKTVANALDGAYETFIEPLLQVSPQVVKALTLDDSSGDGSSGIYKAWAVFRDIANVVFVILFLVVIFSQVTGYGIDNYGIKRMLPRLIIGAVLVNFSFLICQLIVDISNIVGASLQELLTGIGRGISGSEGSSIGKLFGSILRGLGLGVAAGGVAIVASTVLPSLSIASLLSIAITIISALVAVFFGMVLLGARQAIIILLVVTSPVAFVLYLLPNTQTYFRQWTKIFSRLLLVYPAAGLLIGGGYLAAKIIMSVDGGLIMSLVGLIVLVVPYFLIIPLVRTSMNAIAGLGGRLQAYGRGASRGLQGVKRTDAYQSLDAKLRSGGMQERVKRAANVRERRRGVLGRFGRFGNAIADIADVAANERMINEANRIESEEDRILRGEASVYGLRNPGAEATSAKMWKDFTNVKGDDANANRQRKAILMAMEQNGYGKDIIKNAQNRLLEGKGRFENNGEMMALADHLGRNSRTADMLKDEDPEVMKYIAKRKNDGIYERDDVGNLRTKADYMEDNPRVEDITKLSENGIKRGLATGRITMEDLQSTLGPNAPDSIRSRWKSSQKQIAENYMKADNDSKTDIVRQYITEIDSGNEDNRKMEALTYANGGNVMGQSGAVYGIRPDASKMGGTFNADKSFRTNDGKTVLMDSSRGTAWNATDGKEMTGDELNVAQSNIKTNYT